jgi:hypothetical protein
MPCHKPRTARAHQLGENEPIDEAEEARKTTANFLQITADIFKADGGAH